MKTQGETVNSKDCESLGAQWKFFKYPGYNVVYEGVREAS